MVIHLIRHGKTMANEQHLYCGQTDLPLSDNGKHEIVSLCSQAIYPVGDLLFTSGLLRTDQTMKIIYSNMVNRIVVPELKEYGFGSFEMKHYEELKHVKEYQDWIMDETGDLACPKGESKHQFKERVISGYLNVVEQVQQSKASTAIVVVHGGVIACIMEFLYPNRYHRYEWQPLFGHGYTLQYLSDIPEYMMLGSLKCKL